VHWLSKDWPQQQNQMRLNIVHDACAIEPAENVCLVLFKKIYDWLHLGSWRLRLRGFDKIYIASSRAAFWRSHPLVQLLTANPMHMEWDGVSSCTKGWERQNAARELAMYILSKPRSLKRHEPRCSQSYIFLNSTRQTFSAGSIAQASWTIFKRIWFCCWGQSLLNQCTV
jgi:hypothetical protein